MRRLSLIVFVLGIAAGVAFFTWHKPSSSPSRTVSTRFRSYLATPSSRMVAYSPSGEILQDPSHRELRTQLTRLREKFDGLSLYQCAPETPTLVAMAHELGYKAVLLTVWDPRSESELATASSIVRDQSGSMALAISLGNEGLMEKRYTFADLGAARAELLERSAGHDAVEITTTEPWWLYLKPEEKKLREFGDFTSTNIHVVWDTDIADPAIAASWTHDRAKELGDAVGKPILLREAGFPGAGASPRTTVHATFTRDLQAAFWRAWIAIPNQPATVVFEGFDNPEKHWNEFEGSWGLLNYSADAWPAWDAFPALAGSR